jgi:hypothetical protein
MTMAHLIGVICAAFAIWAIISIWKDQENPVPYHERVIWFGCILFAWEIFLLAVIRE